MLIDTVSEFHAYISQSNNYAWRNCNIVDGLAPDQSGGLPAQQGAFRVTGFGRRYYPRDLEIDTRDLPEGTHLALRIPEKWFYGLKAFDVPAKGTGRTAKVGGVLQDVRVGAAPISAIPLSALVREFAEARGLGRMIVRGMRARKYGSWRSLFVPPGRVIRLAGLAPTGDDWIDIQFAVKFPRDTGRHDVALAFRECGRDGVLGQMNYVFRIRKSRKAPK
jgi:hypothetical protein